MFFGTTPQIVSQFVHRELAKTKPARVFVPFAGNFVVEQLAAQASPGCEIHSTDISLYSRAIGYALTNQESEIRLQETWAEALKTWLSGDGTVTNETA